MRSVEDAALNSCGWDSSRSVIVFHFRRELRGVRRYGDEVRSIWNVLSASMSFVVCALSFRQYRQSRASRLSSDCEVVLLSESRGREQSLSTLSSHKVGVSECLLVFQPPPSTGACISENQACVAVVQVPRIGRLRLSIDFLVRPGQESLLKSLAA